jgi:hypothetical protein
MGSFASGVKIGKTHNLVEETGVVKRQGNSVIPLAASRSPNSFSEGEAASGETY